MLIKNIQSQRSHSIEQTEQNTNKKISANLTKSSIQRIGQNADSKTESSESCFSSICNSIKKIFSAIWDLLCCKKSDDEIKPDVKRKLKEVEVLEYLLPIEKQSDEQKAINAKYPKELTAFIPNIAALPVLDLGEKGANRNINFLKPEDMLHSIMRYDANGRPGIAFVIQGKDARLVKYSANDVKPLNAYSAVLSCFQFGKDEWRALEDGSIFRAGIFLRKDDRGYPRLILEGCQLNYSALESIVTGKDPYFKIKD